MIPVPQHIDDYTALLRDRTPFTYANIGGDGEFLTITGWEGTNSDGITSTPDMREKLAQVILDPRLTFHGYNPGRKGSSKLKRAEAWLREHGVNVPDRGRDTLDDPGYGSAEINVRWVHKEIIGAANTSGRLNGFLRALNAVPDLYVVASDNVTEDFCRDVLDASWCWLLSREWGFSDLDHIEGALRWTLDHREPGAAVVFGLGYLTKVLMWRLAPDYPDVTMIDMGACFDPYCGVLNRRKYKMAAWQDAKARNLEGLVEVPV